jgi:hypothetical protein
MDMDENEVRQLALETAQELYHRLEEQAQNPEFAFLSDVAVCITHAKQVWEPRAREELVLQRAVALDTLDSVARARKQAWALYQEPASILATLEGKLAQAEAFVAEGPDIAATPLDEWRDQEARMVANAAAIEELTQRIEIVRSAIQPMLMANAVAQEREQAARDHLASIEDALALEDVFTQAAGRATSAYRDQFLLYSGLWKGDSDSPIGMKWLRASGQGARIEANAEAGARADERAKGPQIRSAPNAHPTWTTTNSPGGYLDYRTGNAEVQDVWGNQA